MGMGTGRGLAGVNCHAGNGTRRGCWRRDSAADGLEEHPGEIHRVLSPLRQVALGAGDHVVPRAIVSAPVRPRDGDYVVGVIPVQKFGPTVEAASVLTLELVCLVLLREDARGTARSRYPSTVVFALHVGVCRSVSPPVFPQPLSVILIVTSLFLPFLASPLGTIAPVILELRGPAGRTIAAKVLGPPGVRRAVGAR